MAQIEQHAAEKEKGSKGVGGSAPDEVGDDYDELLPAAVEGVLETGQASVSMLQRRLKLGYSRAARLVDQMEERGIVGPFEGSKPRQLLITRAQWQEMQMGGDDTMGGGMDTMVPMEPEPTGVPVWVWIVVGVGVVAAVVVVLVVLKKKKAKRRAAQLMEDDDEDI